MIAKNNYIHTTEIHNTKSANTFIPILKDFINPSSVVDIGCGLGTWLKIFKEQGCEEILGIDGNYIDQSQLCIPQENFQLHDLGVPLTLEKKYDLAICLEVVEHLPPDKADIIIETLIKASDTILFSAALPLQGGQNHLNEQSFSYWINKFNQKGFVVKDLFRHQIWDNLEIDWWYKQNTFFVVKADEVQQPILDFYHPQRFIQFAIEFEKYSNTLQGKIPIFDAAKILMKSMIR
jgi:SAM-dependent methyltransferase